MAGTAEALGRSDANARTRFATLLSDRMRLLLMEDYEPMRAQAIVTRNLSWLDGKSSSARRTCLATLNAWLEDHHDPWRAGAHTVDGWLRTRTVSVRDGLYRPVTHATIARHLSVLTSWYAFLVEQGVCATNPAAAIRPPRVPRSVKPSPATLSVAASASLVEYAVEFAVRRGWEIAWRDAALATLLYFTGLPIPTLIRLDLTAVTGHTSTDTPLLLRLGSSNPAGVFMQVPAPAHQPVRTYLALRAAHHQLRPIQLTGPLLATNSRGEGRQDKPLSTSAVASMLTRLAEQAGLPPIPRITPCTRGLPTPAVPALPAIIPLEAS